MNDLILLFLPMSIGYSIGTVLLDIGARGAQVTRREALKGLATLTVGLLQLAGVAYLAAH